MRARGGRGGMSMDTGISGLSQCCTVWVRLCVCRGGYCGPEKPDVKTDAEGQYTLCVHSPPCPWSPPQPCCGLFKPHGQKGRVGEGYLCIWSVWKWGKWFRDHKEAVHVFKCSHSVSWVSLLIVYLSPSKHLTLTIMGFLTWYLKYLLSLMCFSLFWPSDPVWSETYFANQFIDYCTCHNTCRPTLFTFYFPCPLHTPI